MAKLVNNDWFRGVVVAFVIIGAALLVYGVYQFIDAHFGMQDNIAYMRDNGAAIVEPQTSAEAQMFLAADQEYRRLRTQRNYGMINAGIGLVGLGLGWLGYDAVKSSRRKTSNSPQPTAG